MKRNGFTLIELMITVVVIGILATIAYPSYQDQIRRTRRADAEASLSQLANFMERKFTETNCYNAGPDNTCGTADDAAPSLPTAQLANTTNFYNVSLSTITATTYTVTATPITGGAQASDSCGTLSLDHLGAKTPTTSGCW